MRRPERRGGEGPGPGPGPGLTDVRMHPRKRLALMEEIAADVDALEDELASRGVPRERARAAAMNRLFPDPAVVRELETDAVAYHRLAARIGGSRLVLAERVGLAAVALLTLITLARGLAQMDGFRSGGAFLWATIGMIALLVANTLRVAVGLWARQDMGAAERRQAWRVQVGLVLVAISVSALGSASEAYLGALRMEVGAGSLAGFALARDVLILVAMGLGATVIGLVGWLALTPSLRSYESFERRIATVFVAPGPRLVREPAPELSLNRRKAVS
jgi:hypothetical protein